MAATPFVEIVAALLWAWIIHQQWRGYQPPPGIECVAERALGASVIVGQLNGTVSGASIIIAGIGIFVGLGDGDIGPPASHHLAYAALWAVLALAVALYTMGVLPTKVPSQNVVRSSSVAIACALALFFSVAAGVRFVFGFGSILLSSPG